MNSKINGEQAGAVAEIPQGALGTLSNVIATLRENGRYVDEEGEPTDILEDLHEWLLTLAAPGAAVAAREQEAGGSAMRTALQDCLIMIGRIKKHCQITDNAGYTPDGRMLKLTSVEEAAWAALASRQEAPAASGLLSFSLRPEDCIVLHATGPYPLYRCLGCNATDYGAERMEHGTGCRVGAAVKGATTPEQSAKGLTMGGEAQ